MEQPCGALKAAALVLESRSRSSATAVRMPFCEKWGPVEAWNINPRT